MRILISYSFYFFRRFLLTVIARDAFEGGGVGREKGILFDRSGSGPIHNWSPRYRIISYGYIAFAVLASTQEAHGLGVLEWTGHPILARPLLPRG